MEPSEASPFEPDQPLAHRAPPPAPATFLFEEAEAEAPPPRRPGWRAWLWRTAVVYAVLYCLPFPLGIDPWSGPLGADWEPQKQEVITWLTKAIFGVEITALPGGSGDTTYNYFELLFYVVAACALGGLWHWLRRDHAPGRHARDVLRTWVRYYLATVMLGYGFHKAFPLQFGVLDPSQLSATYGQSSPMNLLWTFMAFSPAYTSFVGLCEVLGGLLLLWRSTATLGGLVTAGVMANVVMLNFCYDVPVKLFSTHLCLMGALLCVRDARRLFDFLVRNRATAPAELWPWSPSPWLRWPVRIVKLALVGWVLFSNVHAGIEGLQQRGGEPRPLVGTWQVVGFRKDEVDVPAFTSPERWQRIDVFAFGRACVHRTDGQQTWFVHEVDAQKGELTLSGIAAPPAQAPPPVVLRYTSTDAQHLQLEGTMDGAELQVRLELRPPESFPLVERGFHWINEFPLNRR
jgi:hypothetical protein